MGARIDYINPNADMNPVIAIISLILILIAEILIGDENKGPVMV